MGKSPCRRLATLGRYRTWFDGQCEGLGRCARRARHPHVDVVAAHIV